MSRKDEILSALETALCEREPADSTTLRAALTQFKQEQQRAPARIAPTRRWLALGGGAALVGAAVLGIVMVREPSAAPSGQRSALSDRSSLQESGEVAHGDPQKTASYASAIPPPRPHEEPMERGIAPVAAGKRPLTPPSPKPIYRPIGDDLDYLNADGFDAYTHRVAAFVKSDADALQLQLPEVKGADSFVEVPLPQLAAEDKTANSAALRAYQDEKAISDARLQKRVTLAKKAISFGELLDQLAKETGVNIAATRSVADDKLTIFCKDKPLRELMRMVTQHFGFVWERTGVEPEFVYRLKQPLRNQFLEEELRNKDKNEALLALDREMEGLKKYFDLSPEQAREAADNAQGKEKEKLELLGGVGWGPARLYAGLEADDQAALQGGKNLFYGPGGREIPKEFSEGALNALTGHAFIQGDGISMTSDRKQAKADKLMGKSPAEAGATPAMMLAMQHDELGQVSLMAHSGFSKNGSSAMSGAALATGVSPSASSPKNAEANVAKKSKPEFQKPTDLKGAHKTRAVWKDGKQHPEEAWTSADALEAIHKATGKDVLGDYFTRLVPHKDEKGSLFEVLARTCDPLRLRWDGREGWLTFRSTDFFNMRLKEVPGRLLEKWAAQRKKNGSLTPDDLREISRLTDDQLDARGTAEGAKVLYGLDEWDWVRSENIRPIWRFYDSLPLNLREAMQSEKGVSFSQLGLDGRQKFIAAAYQHHTDLMDAIKKGTVPDVLLKSLESSSQVLLTVPAPSAPKTERAAPFLFEFRIPDETGLKQTRKQVGPGSTSISFQK